MNSTLASNLVTERLGELSDALRLRLLCVLERAELSVGEIAKVLQSPQSTISRHLGILVNGGWLTKRAVGTASLYRFADELLDESRAGLWRVVRDAAPYEIDVEEDALRLEAVLSAREVDTATFFGQVGADWDRIRRELFGDGFMRDVAMSLVPYDMVVADLGAGSGSLAAALAPHVSRVIAIDQSEPMLDAARERLSGVANVDVRAGSLGALPIEDASVDRAVCVLVWHHVEDIESAAREIGRILRPGGSVTVIDMTEHNRAHYRQTMGHLRLGLSERAVRDALSGGGLTDITYRVLPAEQDAKGPSLFCATARRADHA